MVGMSGFPITIADVLMPRNSAYFAQMLHVGERIAVVWSASLSACFVRSQSPNCFRVLSWAASVSGRKPRATTVRVSALCSRSSQGQRHPWDPPEGSGRIAGLQEMKSCSRSTL